MAMNSAPFMTRGNIAVPGAWLINGGSGPGQGGAFPVFNSISNLNVLGLDLYLFGDVADTVLLMPGFRIEIWKDGGYTGTKLLDAKNTTEPEQPQYYDIPNNAASSLKLYNLAGNLIGQPTYT
jgi:hypothetical protein